MVRSKKEAHTEPSEGVSVSILVLLDGALEVCNPLCQSPTNTFQSLFYWMVRSKRVRAGACESEIGVSILVLLDGALEDECYRPPMNACRPVSILVLLDGALEDGLMLTGLSSHFVSILVLLDGALEVMPVVVNPAHKAGFNPCSIGWCARSSADEMAKAKHIGFNPCSIGWCARRCIEGLERQRILQVSILVLLDGALEERISMFYVLCGHVSILVLLDGALEATRKG